MKILITGGFGYVGGRLGEYLSSTTHEIYLGSRSPRPHPKWLAQGSVVQMDWRDEYSLMAACKNMDVVIHTAGMNALECFEDPAMAMEVNGANTERLVQAAQKNAVLKFIYMSTAHIYTNNLTGMITESSKVSNRHPYATSHVAGENAVMDGHSKAAMQSVVVRLANAFGAPLSSSVNCWMLVVNELCRQAAVDRRLIIRGPSMAVRNFITMEDVCIGLQSLICNHKLLSSPLICNLGDKTKTIFDMASAIRTVYADDKKIKLPIFELSKDAPTSNDVDYRSHVLEGLGWQPNSNFKVELSKLIAFCESNFRSDNDN